jgi:methyl-accepting chemotaxis protein
MAFTYDEKGGLSGKCMYFLNEDEPVDEQNNAIINGKKYKVLSFRDSMVFYLQDLYDNTAKNIHEVEDKMQEVKDTMKETVKSLNGLNNLIKKINKNMGEINDLEQAL